MEGEHSKGVSRGWKETTVRRRVDSISRGGGVERVGSGGAAERRRTTPLRYCGRGGLATGVVHLRSQVLAPGAASRSRAASLTFAPGHRKAVPLLWLGGVGPD